MSIPQKLPPCLFAWLALSATAAWSQASQVVVYGIVDAAVEASNQGRGTVGRVIAGGANGNRLGFRGSEDLGGGLSAIFRLEMGFALDDGTQSQGGRAFGREASVGFTSKTLGTLTLGRTPTPYYVSMVSVDATG